MANPAPKIILILAISLSLFVDHPTHVHRFFFLSFYAMSFAVQSSVSLPVFLSPCLCVPFSPSPPVHVGYVQCVGVVCVAVCGVCGVCCVVCVGEGEEGEVTFHDACFSKPLTFHNGFMVFASRSWFKHCTRLQATPLLQKKKNMKPLWKVKGFEKQTSWKVIPLPSVCLERWRTHREKGKVRRNFSGGFKRY